MIGDKRFESMAGAAQTNCNRPSSYPDEMAKPAREAGSVDRELSKLGEALSSHESFLARLVERLRPVTLNVPPPHDNPSTSAPDALVCDVAAQVRQYRRSLEGTTDQLRHFIERIDL